MRHVLDPLALLIVAGGPIPLCLGLLELPRARPRGAAEAWLAVLTAWCALQVALVLVLGGAGVYRKPVVLACEIALAAAGTAWPARRGSGGRLALALAIGQPLDRFERTIVASTAAAGVVFLVRLATRPILDFDSLWYHLPNMAEWYRTGSFEMMDGTGRPVVEQVLRYPYCWEALSSLFFFPFRDDFCVSVPKLVTWAMLGLGVHVLAVRLGARRLHALAAASLTVTVPFLLFDLNTLRVDVPFAAFFVAGVWFALAWAADRSRGDLAFALVSLGLLSGTKMTGPIYAGVIALAALGLRRVRRDAATEPPGSAAPVAVAALLALLAGGFWYARNWIEVGNPFGLVRIDAGGRVLLPGEITIEMIQRTSLARTFDATDPAHWRTLLTQVAARLQLPFALLVVQAAFLPRAFAVARGDARRSMLVTVLILTVLSAALFWAHTGTAAQGFSSRTIGPFLGQGFRYGFGLLGLVAVIAAVSATGVCTGARLVTGAVLAGALCGVLGGTLSEAVKAAAFRGGGVEWASGLLERIGSAPGRALGELAGAMRGQLPGVLASTAFWAGATAVLAIARPGRWTRPRAILLGVIVFVVAAGVGRAQRDDARRDSYGGVPEWISANLAPGGTVAYAFSVYSYLFYGTDLRANVEYVPATSGDEAAWQAALRARGASVVALGPSMGPRRSVEEISADVPELAWLERAGSGWERVLGDDLSVSPWLWRRREP
jgi:hypothetical protein